jgi:predicted nucleic acid-binding protein
VASLRVVLDTNVLVSGLAYPASVPGQIVAAWRRGAIDVVVSRHILDEVARVLPRLNHRLHWDDADFTDLLEILSDLAVLGTLLAAEADCLITGDLDLLALADRHPIVTPAEFWRRHGG